MGVTNTPAPDDIPGIYSVPIGHSGAARYAEMVSHGVDELNRLLVRYALIEKIKALASIFFANSGHFRRRSTPGLAEISLGPERLLESERERARSAATAAGRALGLELGSALPLENTSPWTYTAGPGRFHLHPGVGGQTSSTDQREVQCAFHRRT